jgi:Big-like domain-containing protein
MLLGTGMLMNLPHAGASPELAALLEDVRTAEGRRYGTTDDQGVGMDTAKIVPAPSGERYLAVYHHLIGGAFNVRLATSTDLLHWHYVATLENDASQPTIAELSDGGFLVAYEKTGRGAACGGSGSCLAFQHYPNLDALLAGAEDRSVTVNRTLSACNEGTPNIYAATLHPDLDHSIINVGFHYFRGCDVDRQAIGTLTNFSSWKTQADANLNTLFTNLGTIGGNVGDRDAFLYQGRPYSLVEAQDKKNDFGTWRPYLYDRTANSLTRLELRTHAPGIPPERPSTSFGNPTYTQLRLPGPERKWGFVSTQFIFSEGAAPGEAGPLFYYRSFPTQPAADTPPTVTITQPAQGETVLRRSTVTIKATASDDSGIAKVAFFVNDTLRCVSPFAPYACAWTVPNTSRVTYTLRAEATDAEGDVSSSTVTVTSR